MGRYVISNMKFKILIRFNNMKKEVLASLKTAEKLYKSAKKNSISSINDFMAELTDSGAKDLLIEFKDRNITSNGDTDYGYLKYTPRGAMLLTIPSQDWVPLFPKNKQKVDEVDIPNAEAIQGILNTLLTENYNIITKAQLEYGRWRKWVGNFDKYEYIDFNYDSSFGDKNKRQEIINAIYNIIVITKNINTRKSKNRCEYNYSFKSPQNLTWIRNNTWVVFDKTIGIRIETHNTIKHLYFVKDETNEVISWAVCLEHLENILAVLQEELKN